MTALELIIRPFQTRTFTPPRQVFKAGANPSNVVLLFGGVGETKTFTGNETGRVEYYMTKHTKELSRTTKVKDIKNPDDPTQHVEVETVKTLTSESGRGRNYQKTTETFKND